MSEPREPATLSRPSLLRRIGKKLLLVAVGTLFGLVLLEGAVRLLPERDSFHTRVRAFAAVAVEKDAALGHRLTPGADAEVGGVRYRVSPLGTRGPAPSESASVRVLVLGDSVTMGWGVPEEATFAAQLEGRMKARGLDATVVNGGVLAYGTAQEADWLAELGPKVRPGLVLVGWFPNDAEDEESSTRLPGPSWSRLWRLVAPGVLALEVRWGWRPTPAERAVALHSPGTESLARVTAALGRVKAWCDAHGARGAVLLLPELLPDQSEMAGVYERVATEARAAGLEVLDLRPALAGVDPTGLWVTPDDRHPNADGHARYAKRIDEWLAAGPEGR